MHTDEEIGKAARKAEGFDPEGAALKTTAEYERQRALAPMLWAEVERWRSVDRRHRARIEELEKVLDEVIELLEEQKAAEEA